MEQMTQIASDFFPYAQERLGFDQPVTILLISDEQNSLNPFGKTAHYDPNNMQIALYVDGRHPKDILRSLSHELVHHSQNCRGEFDGGMSAGQGYAQKDPHLRKMEAEAYLLGNGFLFRDYEDSLKENRKMSLKEKLRKSIKKVLKESNNKLDEFNILDPLGQLDSNSVSDDTAAATRWAAETDAVTPRGQWTSEVSYDCTEDVCVPVPGQEAGDYYGPPEGFHYELKNLEDPGDYYERPTYATSKHIPAEEEAARQALYRKSGRRREGPRPYDASVPGPSAITSPKSTLGKRIKTGVEEQMNMEDLIREAVREFIREQTPEIPDIDTGADIADVIPTTVGGVGGGGATVDTGDLETDITLPTTPTELPEPPELPEIPDVPGGATMEEDEQPRFGRLGHEDWSPDPSATAMASQNQVNVAETKETLKEWKNRTLNEMLISKFIKKETK